MRYRMLVVSDTEPHELPEGWVIQSAVPLRTTGVVHATVALILVEIARDKRRLTVDDYKEEVPTAPIGL